MNSAEWKVRITALEWMLAKIQAEINAGLIEMEYAQRCEREDSVRQASIAAFASQDPDRVYATYGDNKIAVIKAVREITGLGLKEAKDLVEQPGGFSISVADLRRSDVHNPFRGAPWTAHTVRQHLLEAGAIVYPTQAVTSR